MAGGKRGIPSREQLQAENEYLRRGGIVEEIGKTARVIVVGLAAVAVAYFIFSAIEAFAGRESNANVAIKFLGIFEVSAIASWAVGGIGFVYGRAQAKLRKTSIARLHARIKDLELQIDPKRTSSRLTALGNTNPEDI